MTCQLAGVQLKHQIKTPLPLPPSPPQKHRHAHVTAGTQATSARTVVSSAPRSLTGCCVLSGTLSHCKGTSGQAPPGLAARPMPGRMEAAAAAGQAWPGMSPLPAPKHAPTPHLLLRSAPASHPSLSLSQCLFVLLRMLGRCDTKWPGQLVGMVAACPIPSKREAWALSGRSAPHPSAGLPEAASQVAGGGVGLCVAYVRILVSRVRPGVFPASPGL